MKTELTIEESLKREKGKIFPSDMSEHTLLAVAHSYNCIEALQKQIAKKPEDERCLIKDRENIGLCPSCGEGVNSNYPYCGHCGQRIKWDVEWYMEVER